ncbi:MAG: EamA family transporter [Clostridiaceae bacterium]|nr:EamA family transporter [Clostridiaceae bacterium]
MIKYVFIGVVSVTVSCISQILLKLSAMQEWPSRIKEYLNTYVITGYLLTTSSVFLTILMYKGLQLKYGVIIESLGYIIILILSKFFLREKISKSKVVGNIIIVIGIVIFGI